METRYDFKDLTFFLRRTFNLNGINIPLYIHIKDVKSSPIVEEIKIKTKNDIDDFDYIYEEIETMKYYKYLFKFINTSEKIYDNFSKTFLEFYNINNTDDLFYIFDEIDINTIKNEIEIFVGFIMNEFRYRLYNSLKLDIDTPEIKLKDEHRMEDNIKEYLKPTQTYISGQMGMEFNNNVFFSENIGRSVEEFSFREIEFRKAYLTIKFNTESLIDRWSAKKNEDLYEK